jgi:hypothetical protein
VALAENNLKQVSTGLELYFHKYGSYPPEGSDLAYVLGPFVRDKSAFSNPLKEEPTPGQTLSDLYVEPSTADIDRPGVYVTAFPSDNGSTIVVLKTAGKVERYKDLAFNPNDAEGLVAMLMGGGTTPPAATTTTDTGTGSGTTGGTTGDTTPLPGTSEITGDLNLNPNNKDDFEFEMQKGDGSMVTRDDLLGSNGRYSYEGAASSIRFRPKGNGNQNGIILNGRPYRVYNSTTYLILVMKDANGNYMSEVRLYNRNQRGSAMGRWWMSIKTPPGGAQLYIVEPGPSGSGETFTLVVDSQ